MQLHGLSKLTLLDYPGHLACTAFTGACNFRCPFCHNAPLVLTPASCPPISEDEFFDFLKARSGKLEGVCITGGEPTLQKDLSDFIRQIRSLGFSVKLDTNGYQPEILSALLQEKLLNAVAMDIKNGTTSYAKTAGIPDRDFDISRITKSITLLLQSGIPHEFRTTVTTELHTEVDFAEIALWLQELCTDTLHTPVCQTPYYLQKFKPSDQLICGESTCFTTPSEQVLQQFVSLLKPTFPNIFLRG